MRIKLLLFMVWAVAYSAAGQTKKIVYGIRTSADWNSYLLVKDDGVVDFKGKPGFSVGAVLRYPLSKHFSVDVGLRYSMKSFEEKIDHGKLFAIDNDDIVLINDTDMRLVHKHGFMEVPVTLNYRFITTDATDFYTSLGVAGAALVKYSYREQDWFMNNQNTPPYRDFLVSTTIGIGVLFKTKAIGIAIEPQVGVFLSKVHNSTGYVEENPLHFGLQVSLLKL